MSKWLLRKASGSRAKYKLSGDYADTRNAKKPDLDHLPKYEPMGKRQYSYLDTRLVKRWLYAQVGKNFDEVYAEFLTRIQPKYLEQYCECIFWYVQKHVEIKENGELWGQWNGDLVKLPYSRQDTFYIHPDTNKLTCFKHHTNAQ